LLPFRFGYQTLISAAPELRTQALNAESAGFDVFHTLDHFGDYWAPFTTLAAVAAWTNRIRVCPLVINNDYHLPLDVAREVISLDRLSGGRAELGLGAGHAFTEYSALGLRFDPAPVRKQRLQEAAEILAAALRGDTVTYLGQHYQISEASILRPAQANIPLLIGVNGPTALAYAAKSADIVGLTMFGRTLPDGQRHEMRWQSERLDRTIEWVKFNSSARERPPELHALVHIVKITNDRRGFAQELAEHVPGLAVDDALETPFLAFGTHDEIAQQYLSHRRRWGISYFTVRDIDNFEPVIAQLRQADRAEGWGGGSETDPSGGR